MPSTHGCNSQKSIAELEAEKTLNDIANENIMSKPSAILAKFHGKISEDVPIADDTKLRRKIAYKREKTYDTTSGRRDDVVKILDEMKTLSGDNFVLYSSFFYLRSFATKTDATFSEVQRNRMRRFRNCDVLV